MTLPSQKVPPEAVFLALCDTAALAGGMHKKDAATNAGSLEALDQAASLLLPGALQAGNTATLLYAAAKTLRPGIVKAFPAARPGAYSATMISGEVRRRLEQADADFLRLLHSRGFHFSVLHQPLVLRAMRKRDVALQRFLLDIVGDQITANFRWLHELKAKDEGRSGAFLSSYLNAAVRAHPASAQELMKTCFLSRKGITFALLASAGVPLPDPKQTWIPDDLKSRVTSLNNHSLFKLLPDGPDIASFWENPEKIATIKDFFAFRPLEVEA